MKILAKFGVDGLISSKRGEVFQAPSDTKFGEDVKDNEWNVEGSSLLHAWLTEGASGSELTLPPAVTRVGLTSPSRAVLEASLSSRLPVTLPRGPLDIFHPIKPSSSTSM